MITLLLIAVLFGLSVALLVPPIRALIHHLAAIAAELRALRIHVTQPAVPSPRAASLPPSLPAPVRSEVRPQAVRPAPVRVVEPTPARTDEDDEGATQVYDSPTLLSLRCELPRPPALPEIEEGGAA